MKLISLLIPVCTAAFTLGLSAQTSPAPAKTIQVGTGFDYSRGDYGLAEDTTVTSIPFTLSYDHQRWNFRASLPYLWIKGPADVVVVGPGSVSNSRSPSTPRSERGLGDLMGSTTYRFDPIRETHFEPTVRVKFPTADDDKGLGTSKTDFYTQVDVYRTFGDLTPYGSVGYRFLGSSTRYPLKNGLYLSGGALFRLTDRTQVGAGADWRQPLVAGGDQAKELNAFVIHRMSDQWSLQVYALKGFTNASPNIGAGTAISLRF